MATPAEKLASSLEVLQELQEQDLVAIRSSQLTRTHRERLLKNGFLQEVMKGCEQLKLLAENSGNREQELDLPATILSLS